VGEVVEQFILMGRAMLMVPLEVEVEVVAQVGARAGLVMTEFHTIELY
jgi:hypothetical protein